MASVVTALKLQPKNRSRLNVYLDGEFGFAVARAVAAGLSLGQSLSPAQIAALQASDAEEAACRQGLRLLSRRPRSEGELRAAWRRRQVAEGVQEAALARLRQMGQLDDRAFAATWIENRAAFRPRAAAALKDELRRKGVPAEAIKAALEGFDEDEAARAAARRSARRFQDLPWETFHQRLGAYLARRGFAYATVAPIIEQVWNELHGASDESEVLT